MNRAGNPDCWDDDDSRIAQLLNSTPVPEAARRSAREYLLEKCSTFHSLVEQSCIAVPSQAESTLESGVWSKVQSRRVFSLRAWMAVSVVAASVVIGWYWWSSNSHLSHQQLMAICSEQISQVSNWEIPGEQVSQSELTRFSEVLRKYLAVAADGEIETQALSRTGVSSSGRIWRIPIANKRELYVFEFTAPRRVKFLDSRLQLLKGLSNGWSLAAVESGDRLLVFMSRDELKRSLRFMPLA